MSLGGRLSIALALAWAVAWGTILPEHLPVPVHEAATLGVMVLSFPLAIAFLWPMDTGPSGLAEVVLYFCMLVPNVFVLGYGIAAILRFLTWLNGPLFQKPVDPATRDAAPGSEG